jgi:hypothetical protein
MSYTRHSLDGSPLDSVIGALKKYVPTVGTTVEAGKAILDDPALPQLTGYVLELRAIEAKKGKAAPAGIGLSEIVPPVRYYVYTKKHAWVVPALVVAAVAALVGLPTLVGYAVGKRRRT